LYFIENFQMFGTIVHTIDNVLHFAKSNQTRQGFAAFF